MTICLDVSNYDYDTFDADCMKAAGVDKLIIGCQRPEIARWMCTEAQRAGIEIIGVYAYIYFGVDTIGQTKAAIDVAKEYGIGTVWIDVEDTSGGTIDSRLSEVRKTVNLVEEAGLNAGIYTGGWYWPTYMADTNEFSRLPLWHSAYWDDHREVRNVSYGGWNAVAIHQYTSTLSICGRNRDANYVFEEDDMPDPRIDELWRRTGGDKGVNFDVLKLVDNQNTATMDLLRALITNLRQLASELEAIAS